MVGETVLMVTIIQVLAILSVLLVYATRYKKVPPDRAMVVYGRQMHPGVKIGYAVISGGGRFLLPVIEETAVLDLAVREVVMELDNVRTDPGEGSRPVRVKLSVLYRISSDREELYLAAQNLLGRTPQDVKRMVQMVVEGSVREVATTRTARSMDIDREGAATEVGLKSARDLAEVGLEIRGLNIIRIVHKGVDRIG